MHFSTVANFITTFVFLGLLFWNHYDDKYELHNISRDHAAINSNIHADDFFGTQSFLQQASSPFAHTGRGSNNTITDNLNRMKSYGYWKISGSQRVHGFNNDQGETKSIFNQDHMNFKLLLVDGVYEDQKKVLLSINYTDSDYNQANKSLSSSNASLSIYYSDNFVLTNKTENCSCVLQVKYFYTESGAPANQSDDLPINSSLVVNSSKCGIFIEAIYINRNSEMRTATIYYSLFVMVLSALQIYLSWRKIEYYKEHPAEINKLSLLGVGFVACWDLLFMLFHVIEAAMDSDYLPFFLMPIFSYFILGTVGFYLQVQLWLGRTMLTSENPNRERMLLFLKLCTQVSAILCLFFDLIGAVLGPILLVAERFIFALFSFWFLLIGSGIFFSQIVYNAIRGHRFRITWEYYVNYGILRPIVFLYMKACPYNVLKLTPEQTICGYFVGIVLLQMAVLYLQGVLGSRFFIPKCILPKRFDYFEISLKNVTGEPEDCAICMECLHVKAADNTSDSTPDRTLLRSVRLMQTPCRHQYHESCLRDWMDRKLQCPLCEAPIPALED